MIPDLAWWGRLFGLLATEAALLVALAAVVARLTRSAQWRRLIWQTAFLAVALVWFLELGGGRGWMARWRPVPAPARQVTARVIGESTVRAEPVAFEFPAAVPVADLPPTPVQPRWWPGAFWLAGLGALWLKALGSRVWLAWRIRAVHEPELGQAASLPAAVSNEAPLAEVAATVARLRTVLGVGPVRLVAWPRLRGPVAFGIFRPTVAVPADFEARFTPVQREAMLAHELAHLANRDPLWLLVAELVCALAWWHPLMWWARRQFRAACEAAADEASTLVPGGRVALAEALVNFGRELTAPGGVGVAGSGLKSELARRVKALMEPGDARAVRTSGRWLLRGGMALVLGALLSVPWPGELGGLGPLWAAVKAEAIKPSERSAKPLETVSELLADPKLREVVKAMEAADAREGQEPSSSSIFPPLPPAVAYEVSTARSAAVQHRTLGTYVPLRGSGAEPTIIVPEFEFPGETLAEAASRLRIAVKQAAPEGLGITVSLFASPGLEAVRIRPGPTLQNFDLSLVLAMLVESAESPLEASLEGSAVLLAAGSPGLPDTIIGVKSAVQELRSARLELDATRILHPLGSTQLAAAESRHSEAERVIFSLVKQWKLVTRQFRLSARAFTAHLQSFLPPGETNVQALQLAVRTFCATNGVEFPAMITNAPGATPPLDQPAIFYNDRTGQLFVRATLESLERLERTIQKLNLPPASPQEADPPTREPGPSPLTSSPRLATNVAYEQPAAHGLSRSSGFYLEPRVGANPTNISSKLALPGSPLAVAVSGHEAAQLALQTQAKQSQLSTRQFRLAARDFTAHLRSYLPPGETNAQALQLAVRAFCATNGVEFPAGITNAPGATPPLDQPAIFYNDRTGQLFVRATLENLERLEHAIQQLNLPAAETDRSRAELVDRLRTTKATLDELLTRYKDGHPKVRAAAKDYFEAKRATEESEPPQPRRAGGQPSPDEKGDSEVDTEQMKATTQWQVAQQIDQYRATLERQRVARGDNHPEVVAIRENLTALQGQYDAMQRFTQRKATDGLQRATQRTSTPTNAGAVQTRQFRVDPDKFAARVLAGFDPAEEAVRRMEALPNRSLIASDVGASVPSRTLPSAVSKTPLPGFNGGGEDAGPNLQEAARAYFRRQGVEFAPPVASAAAPPPESSALFYNPNAGILFVRASLDDLAKVEQALVGLEPPVAATSMPGPQVQLAVFFVEIEERGADDLGLDWLFGQPRTNNPVPVTQFLTNAPGSATALQGDRLRVERLEVAGQWAVLSGEQFGALRQRLEGRAGVDFLSAPQVISLSDRQAQVSVGDVRTLVTGVVATDGSATNDADIRYVTDQVSVGPVVDLFPRAEGDGWRVRVVASLNEFLGYDAPGKTNRVQARTPGKPPMRRDVPLPRLRKRETQAEALAQPGEIIALRGPLATNVVQTKDKVPVLGDVPLLGRLFRRESTQTQRKRLYVFVQPTTVDAQGNVVEPAGAK